MKTLSQHLKAYSYGKFINNENQYCKVSTYYIKNKFNIMIIFQNENETAYANAILTTSIKKAEKILNEGNFKNVND